jgi:hypothetical protein
MEGFLRHLENYKYPYFVETQIRKRLKFLNDKKTNPFLSRKIMYEEAIKNLEQEIKKRNPDSPKHPTNITYSKPDESSIKPLAKEISLYFSQAYELFKASVGISIHSSPLTEYYGLLQLVKGVVLTELEFPREKVFNHHGIDRAKRNPNSIHQGRIKTHGVFPALLIRCQGYEGITNSIKPIDINDYYSQQFYPTFENFISDDFQKLKRPPETFIFSWMLSEIVRYNPLKWQEICTGEKNDWIRKINKFRNGYFIETLKSLTIDLIYKKTLKYKI